MHRAGPVSRLSSLVSRGAIAPLLFGCSLSPLAHRISVGDEPFVIFVGEGIDHHTDLFAVPAGGGAVAQVTFTPLVERSPRLTPTGEVVAFLRARDTLPTTHRDVVLMNLLSGGEVVVRLPPVAGQPLAVAWNAGATQLYIRTDRGVWQSAAPPNLPLVLPVPAADSVAADSALRVWLGTPRFARVIACPGGGLCIIGPQHDTTSLAPRGESAIRWGDDSVAWIESGSIIVRSLGPGRARKVAWQNPPVDPRDASYASGAVKP